MAGCNSDTIENKSKECEITPQAYIAKSNELKNAIDNFKKNMNLAEWFLNTYISNDEINGDSIHSNYNSRKTFLTQSEINNNCDLYINEIKSMDGSIKNYNKISDAIDNVRLNSQDIISNSNCEANNNCNDVLNSRVDNIITDNSLITYRTENTIQSKPECNLNKASTTNKLNSYISKLTNYKNLINHTKWLKINLAADNYNSEIAKLNHHKNQLRLVYAGEFKFECSEYLETLNQYKPEIDYIDSTTPIIIALKNKYRDCNSSTCMKIAFDEFKEKTKVYDKTMEKSYQNSY